MPTKLPWSTRVFITKKLANHPHLGPFLLVVSLVLTWLQNSLSSSNYMKLTTLCLTSLRFDAGFLHKLSENSSALSAITIWWIAKSRLSFRMLNATLSNHSIKVQRDSVFSYLRLTKGIKVRWWGKPVANCAWNFVTKVVDWMQVKASEWKVLILLKY